jgi:hypothetical protein
MAGADTAPPGQVNACWSKLTNTWATFPLVITGLSATPINQGATTTLTGTSITFGVGASLALAGIGAGVLTGAPNVATMGFPGVDPINGNTFPQLGVNSATGSAQLSIQATNSVEGQQRVVQPSLTASFVIITDGTAAGTTVYSVGPGGVIPGTLTNLTAVPAVIVPINFPDTTWTNNGSGPNMVFTERNTVPTLPTPTTAQLQPGIPDLFIGVNLGVQANFYCWPGQSQGALDTTQTPPVPGSSANMTPVPQTAGIPAGAPPNVLTPISTTVVTFPATAPKCATPQSGSVGAGQSTTVTPSCTNNNPPFNLGTSTVAITSPATAGSAVVGAGNVITYTNTNTSAASDTFSYTVANSVGPSNTVVVTITILGNQCTVPGGQTGGSGAPGPSQDGTLTAQGTSCSLGQVLILPVEPGSLSMSEAAGHGNPDFGHAILGGVVNPATFSCGAGPITLNGQPQTACGALNPVTVVNARGTDAQWTLTGQVTDFIDGTRGPKDTCSPGRNIDQTPPNNHCIPGDNLGWVPLANIMDPSVPGDTAAVAAGAIILPPNTTPQTLIPFPPSIAGARNNVNSVLPPYSLLGGIASPTPGPGLHDVAQQLCSSPPNQSGGTFQCDAGLLLAVPGSAAAARTPGYEATLTLTLT